MSEPVKFRKRPVEVEAFQMTQERRWDNSEWPEWLHAAWQRGAGEGGLWCDADSPHSALSVGALGGVVNVEWGDWIIRGVKGELYPCKQDIFTETYEVLDE